MEGSSGKENFYPTIGEVVESEEHLPTVVESLCMNCHKQNETKLLLTDIPFFRQVILSSSYCPHCYDKTVEVQTGSAVQDKGCIYNLEILNEADLQRQIVKSEYANIRFEELDFEIPSKIGKLTTIEGLLKDALEDLQSTVKENTLEAKQNEKLIEYLPKITMAASGLSFPLTLIVNDPTGNSFVENLLAPNKDPQLDITFYYRSEEQMKKIGLEIDPTKHKKEGSNINANVKRNERVTVQKLDNEHLKIPAECPNCQIPGYSEMCLINVPFFKEVIIFAFSCESCGFRNNEVKGGGAIPDKGKKIILKVNINNFNSDMRRDVVKSTSAGVYIPEIDLEVTTGSLGGIYTTLEGLLKQIYDRLFDSSFTNDSNNNNLAFMKGDSAPKEKISKFEQFKHKFDDIINGKVDFTIIIDDPLDNSFLYSPTAPEPEPRLSFEFYERTHEQNEDFGLNDMDAGGYEVEQEHEHSGPKLYKMKQLQAKGKEAHPDEKYVGMPEEYEHETVS